MHDNYAELTLIGGTIAKINGKAQKVHWTKNGGTQDVDTWSRNGCQS